MLNYEALLAPILKLWLLLKPLLFKTLPALLLWIWVHTGAKLIGWLGELTVLISTLIGGWKAWSGKKLARQAGRFFLSLSAKFVAVSVLINLLFSHERRGVRSLPRLAIHRLHTTWLGRVIRFWKNRTERQKRLILGVVLCLILVLAGQAMLGVSVLLFDLIWELLLLIWRLVIVLWRIIAPLLLKLLPNFVGNFLTKKLLPLLANLVPMIKDDHRVTYLRLNFRTHHRRLKAWLYLRSRSRRNSVRGRITSLMSDDLRSRKSALLDAAAKLDKDADADKDKVKDKDTYTDKEDK